MNKTLLIFTHNYPLDCGDTAFISTEIAFLSKKFDKILVVCLSKEEQCQVKMPENCKVYFWKPHKKLRRLFNALVSTFLWRNIGLLREEELERKNTKRNSFSNTVVGFRFFIRAVEIREHLQQIIAIEGKPDLIYSFWFDAEVLASTMLGYDIPVCTRAHRYDLYEERTRYNYQPFKRIADRSIDSVFFISAQGMHYYLKRFATKKAENYSVFYLGTPSIKKGYDKHPFIDTFELISISSLIQVKRVDVIIEALGLVDLNIKIHWIHIGGGDLDREIKALANKKLSNCNNVTYDFLGFMSHEEVMSYLNTHSFHCFINTSSSEGLPVSMMEALSCSIPIIGTDVGGVKEIIDDTNGILLPASALPKDYAKSIEHLAKMEPTAYEMLRYMAFEKWQRFFNAEVNYAEFSRKLRELSEKT